MVTLLYLGHSPISWSSSYMLVTLWFTLVHSPTFKWPLSLILIQVHFAIREIPTCPAGWSKADLNLKSFQNGGKWFKVLLCTLWESGTPYCALKIIRTPRCLHSLTTEGKIVKSQIGNIICTLLILHCQLHLAQQISYLYLSLYFAFVSVMHLYLYLYLHLYILKRYHLCFVFGKDMMGPVLDVEVDSSETEDRVHQAD